MTYHSQLSQDRWVHTILGDKRDGFFVELGASDSVFMSNSLFLKGSSAGRGFALSLTMATLKS